MLIMAQNVDFPVPPLPVETITLVISPLIFFTLLVSGSYQRADISRGYVPGTLLAPNVPYDRHLVNLLHSLTCPVARWPS